MKALQLLALVALLAGCSSKELESRVSKLESKTDSIQKEVTVIRDGISGIIDSLDKMQSNQVHAVNAILTTNALSHLQFQQALIEIQLAAQSAPNQTPVAPRQGQSMRSGVPATVYNQIASDAAKKWPRDYDMQQYEIKKQIDAYLKISGR